MQREALQTRIIMPFTTFKSESPTSVNRSPRLRPVDVGDSDFHDFSEGNNPVTTMCSQNTPEQEIVLPPKAYQMPCYHNAVSAELTLFEYKFRCFSQLFITTATFSRTKISVIQEKELNLHSETMYVAYIYSPKDYNKQKYKQLNFQQLCQTVRRRKDTRFLRTSARRD